ncbi:hypothetical protein CEXT_251251 [Caerostris extrusa]|uniref:Uncharacterized protein n=1 Tax=Caerostris extrusa TaxID=172846 RepID=A0AAV4VYN3_CAEEX|nr:hypothetical protein CEXT_251251 [Caerostris extrusa]
MESLDTSANEREERALLRENYLRTLKFISNQSAKIELTNNKTLTGIYKMYQPDEIMLFYNLRIPMREVYPYALVKTSDIKSITFSEENP